MSTRILVPLDGSHLALESLPIALKLTRLWKGQLCLLRVVPPVRENFLWDWSQVAPIKKKESAEEYLNNIVKDLTEAKENPLAADQVYPLVIESPSTGQAIADEASKQGTDFIIMTTHGRSGLSELVLGSTAHEVIRFTNLPVIFLRPTLLHPTGQPDSNIYLKDYKEFSGPVVVALDGTPEAEISLAPALDLAEQLQLPVQLLRVIPPFVPVDELASWYEANIDRGYEYLHEHDFEHIKEEATCYLEDLATKMDLHKLNGKVALRVGDAVNEIIDYANLRKASLVVMATHPHGRLEQAMLGTVASQVLTRGNFPVVMVNLAFVKAKAMPVTHH
ncbi:MAG: universal stress protein [Chloroflexi bacterium]|nr:universal stress protein [Chloroflexota bacterium]